jgi:alpha-tubulin suppressor-like RCC1 family protein
MVIAVVALASVACSETRSDQVFVCGTDAECVGGEVCRFCADGVSVCAAPAATLPDRCDPGVDVAEESTGSDIHDAGDGAVDDVADDAETTGSSAVVRELACGGGCCGIRPNGTLLCWGPNDHGQLGQGITSTLEPIVEVTIGPVDQVVMGWEHTCARQGERLSCWGANDVGQCGQGTRDDVLTPVQVLDGVAAVAQRDATCALKTDGTVVCWGLVLDGTSLTNATSSPDMQVVAGINARDNVVAIDVGGEFACVLDQRGDRVRCWGNNDFGQLGDDTVFDSVVPTTAVLPAGTRLTAIAAGADHVCAIQSAPTAAVLCWGDNLSGQVGMDAFTPNVLTPQPVAFFDQGVRLLSSGRFNSCAVDMGGSVYCWGGNKFGQLGTLQVTFSAEPRAVTPVAGATMLATGYQQVCTAHGDGRVMYFASVA